MTDTTNAWSKYQSSESVLKATGSQLKAAEIANEGITLEYDSGNTRTTLEVIQSRSLLLNARIDYAKAQRDFVISKFELAFNLGSLSKYILNHYKMAIYKAFIYLAKKNKMCTFTLTI